MSTFIVCWTEGIRDDGSDHYEVFMDEDTKSNLLAAKFRYDELVKHESVYSANLCQVIESTDYK